jgi:LEA14-like dessication related protein
MIKPDKTSLKWLRMLPLALGCLTLFSCQKPLIPEYQAFENFGISQIGLGESVVSADLKYYNPNNYALQLKRADLNISLDDKPVGTSILDTLIMIPKRDTFLLPVKMRVNIKQLLSNALSLLLNSEIDVKVNGSVRLGKSGVFFNMPVNYSGKQKIEW